MAFTHRFRFLSILTFTLHVFTKYARRSEDGKTFFVKQPDEFSSKIIPQFFKHSKFSSFVRQLNFYGFRKIKYTDNIKIDEKLEEETKGYWRFRHEFFCKGREDLLIGIKRSVASQNDKKSTTAETSTPPKNTPIESKDDVNDLKQELNTLKDKIAKMTDNIDTLTNLVHNVKLDETQSNVKKEEGIHVGSKRKKIDESMQMTDVTEVDEVTSSNAIALDDVMSFSLGPMDESDALECISFAPTPSRPMLRQNSESSSLSDEAFIDELFNVFDDSDMEILPEPVTSEVMPEIVLSSSASTSCEEIPMTSPVSPLAKQDKSSVSWRQNHNKPDQELMKKLSDALSVLPKDMQEMLVNRLIATITSSHALKSHLDSITESKDKSISAIPTNQVSLSGTAIEKNPDIVLPLAAATLTALMTQLSAASCQKNKCLTNGKSLPVIPIHA